jgi:aquaporin Z
MNRRIFASELLGTFTLAFAVRLSVIHSLPVPITPLLAAMVLGLFVYTVGPISGSHLNPAITLGLLSVGKLRLKNALYYVLAQLVGACAALFLTYVLTGVPLSVEIDEPLLLIAFAEAFGTFFLAFGIASVVEGKAPAAASGLVIGGSLLLGILLASPFSAGILNPAVALALLADKLFLYAVAPIVGSIAGFWTYRFISPAVKKH